MDGSGLRRVILNTRERVVSTDINDAQRYSAAMLAELLRWLVDPEQNVDTTPGYETVGAGTETPQRRAYVLGGLRFEPMAASTSAVVSAGSVLFIDNPLPQTDSLATLVHDAGVQMLGQLVLTVGGGSTRIDVVECQPVLTVEQQSNRDIFDMVTGGFTSALVNKLQAGHLVYRIRTGTAGNGFPGLSAGWLPIAVCSVPAGAANWDAVTVWDVRPLVSDLADGPFQNIRQEKGIARTEVYSDVATAGQTRLYGTSEGVYRQWKAGGRLLSLGLQYVDIRASANWANSFAGFPTAALSPWTLYAVFPFGLPRWVRYSTTAPRVPAGQRGILAITSVSPQYDGRPAAAGLVSSPAVTGLLDPAGLDAIALVSGRCNATGLPLGVSVASGTTTLLDVVASPSANPIPINTATGTYAEWDLTAGVHFPGNARLLYVRIEGIVDVVVTTPPFTVDVDTVVTVTNANGVVAYTTVAHATGDSKYIGELTTSKTVRVRTTARVPLVHDIYTLNVPRLFRVRWAIVPFVTTGVGTNNVAVSSSLHVIGWKV
jgi:hypothetical protein